jgi:hypothetical protein
MVNAISSEEKNKICLEWLEDADGPTLVLQLLAAVLFVSELGLRRGPRRFIRKLHIRRLIAIVAWSTRSGYQISCIDALNAFRRYSFSRENAIGLE